MSYLKSKDGSIEASIKEMQKNLKDSAYQKMFKKELEKAGKGIGAMTPAEKKAFFNKIDSKYTAKNEAKVDELTSAQKKLPPALQKAIKDKEQKEDLDSKDAPTVKDVVGQLKKAVKAHDKQAKDLEKAMKTEKVETGPNTDQMHDYKKAKSKDPKAGEKEPMKMNTEEESFDIEKLKEDVNTLWSMAADELEEMKKNAKYMKAQDVAPSNDADGESEKTKGKTLVGSKQTKIETEPKVDYQK